MIRTFQILHANFQLFVDFQACIVHLPQGGNLLFHVLQNEQITRVFIEQCNFEVEQLRKSLQLEFSYCAPRLSLFKSYTLQKSHTEDAEAISKIIRK